MNKLLKYYSEVSRRLVEKKLYEDPSIDFVSLCNEIGVESGLMNELFVKELGVDGEDFFNILLRLRKS